VLAVAETPGVKISDLVKNRLGEGRLENYPNGVVAASIPS
jgi:hypothetical protein